MYELIMSGFFFWKIIMFGFIKILRPPIYAILFTPKCITLDQGKFYSTIFLFKIAIKTL